MKLTKSKLKQLIKEELKKTLSEDEDYFGDPEEVTRVPADEYTPEQQKVVDAIENLTDLVYEMQRSNPEMTDFYIQLFRALNSAGVNTTNVAMMA